MPRKTEIESLRERCAALASMRPRPDAAENHGAPGGWRCPLRASMRPRPDAAENYPADTRCNRENSGFNEAAARCRGKPSR